MYAAASLVNKGITFITMPIFTRLMSTEQIGIVNTYNSWHSILNVFACLSLTAGSFSIAMHQYRNKRSAYQSAALGLTTIASLGIAILYVIFFKTINAVLELPWQLNVLMIVGFFLQPATDFWMARQRFEYKYKACSIVSVNTAITSSLLAVLTVIAFNTNGISELAIGRLYATYLVNYIVALVIFIYTFRAGKTFYDREFWMFGLSMSLPLIVHSLAKQILDASDRIMIQKMVGYSAVGIYGTLYGISSLSLIVWNAINMSLVPYTFSNLDKGKEGEERINAIVIPMLLVYSVVAIGFAFLSPEIVRIVATTEYYEAIYICPPVAAGIYFTSLYNIMGNVLLYHKKTKDIMFATVIAATVNIVLNYIFIQMFGYIAAAYTTLLANIILAFAQYKMAKKVHGYAPYDCKKLVLISVIVTVIVLSCNFLYQHTLLRFVFIGMILVVGFIQRKRILTLFKTILKSKT